MHCTCTPGPTETHGLPTGRAEEGRNLGGMPVLVLVLGIDLVIAIAIGYWLLDVVGATLVPSCGVGLVLAVVVPVVVAVVVSIHCFTGVLRVVCPVCSAVVWCGVIS